MRDPVVVKRHSLQPETVLHPVTMSLSVPADYAPTGSMVLLKDAPDVPMGAWVHAVTPQNKPVVLRATGIDTDYVTGLRTVTLGSMWELLDHRLISYQKTAKADAAIAAMMAKQNDFLFDGCEFTTSLPLDLKNVSIKAGIDTVLGCLNNWQMSIDWSAYPFKVRFYERPVEAVCEMRLGRNATSVKHKVDTSGMYTRMIATGADDISITPMERNVDVYGLIEHYESNTAIESTGHLKTWAQARLDNHCEPQVSVSVSGLELSESTGEPFDRLLAGTICRVPLPEYGTSVAGRIDGISWSDMVKQPEAVSVSISNKRSDATTLSGKVQTVVEAAKAVSRSSGRSGAKAQQGINSMVGRIDGNYSLIQQAENCITAVVSSLAGSSKFEMTSTSITAVLRDPKQGIIGGLKSEVQTIGGQVASVMTIYDRLVNVVNCMTVGSVLRVNRGMVVSGPLDCYSLTVGGSQFSATSISGVKSWSAGSAETRTIYAPIKPEDYVKQADGTYKIKSLSAVTVVHRVTTPTLTTVGRSALCRVGGE